MPDNHKVAKFKQYLLFFIVKNKKCFWKMYCTIATYIIWRIKCALAFFRSTHEAPKRSIYSFLFVCFLQQLRIVIHFWFNQACTLDGTTPNRSLGVWQTNSVKTTFHTYCKLQTWYQKDYKKTVALKTANLSHTYKWINANVLDSTY